MGERNRMLVFEDVVSEKQASVIRSIYTLLSELPDDICRVIAIDLAQRYDGTHNDGQES